MTLLMVLTGAAFGLTGGLLLYSASPNQRLWTHGAPGRLGGWSGLGCLVVSLTLLLQVMGSGAAVFTLLTLLMLVLTALPFLAAWRRARAENGQ